MKKLAICGCMLMATGAASTSWAAYIDTITAQDPLFYWQLNDATGTTGNIAVQIDNSPTYNSNATITSAVSTGQTSGAALTPDGGFPGFDASNSWFTFDGVTSGSFIASLTTPVTSPASMSSTAGSVSYWIKTTATPAAGVYANQYRFDAGATGTLYLSTDSAGKLELRIANGNNEATVLADAISSESIDDGNWHYIAATWDHADNTASIYIDGGSDVPGGETDTVTFASGTDFTSTGRNQFGKGTNNASLFNGSADELAIWQNVLTPADIAAQYEAAVSAVPEPASSAIVLTSIGGLLLRRRKA